MEATIGGRVIQMEDAEGFPVAVKRWHKAEVPTERARWEQEILNLIQGPGVPRVIRSFEDADYLYLVTEWISGLTLDKYVEQQGGFLDKAEALYIGAVLYRILMRLHNSRQGVLVYTDLKPSNVILKGKQVFLVDFESVCPSGQVPICCDKQTVIMGSRPYTAPEVFTGNISPACDFYSLGVLLFFMITGSVWRGEAGCLQEDAVGSRILKLLSPDPGKRKCGLRLFQKASLSGESCIVVPVDSGRVRETMQNLSVTSAKILFIDDNPRFAVELAYEASRRMNLRVGLFSAGEEYIPMAARNLGIHCVKLPDRELPDQEAERALFHSCGTKEWMEQGFLMQPEGFGRLYIGLRSPDRLMGHIDCQGWGIFVHWAANQFDMTVIFGHMEREYLVTFCDAVIVAPQSNLWDAEVCRYKKEKFCQSGLSASLRFVAWEYKEGISLNPEKFSSIVGNADFLGEIYHDGNRQIAENTGHTPYCFSMPGLIRQQYKTVIQKIVNYTESE